MSIPSKLWEPHTRELQQTLWAMLSRDRLVGRKGRQRDMAVLVDNKLGSTQSYWEFGNCVFSELLFPKASGPGA